MFSGASNFANDVDKTFLFIIGVGMFFLVGLTTTMIVFAVRYRKSKHPQAVQIKESMTLEVVWTIIPLIIVLTMFWYGYAAFMPTRKIPKDAMPVRVIGKMWNWTFDYGNGKIVTDTLVVPVGKAIRLNMESPDVTHSFYVPAFRIKEDLVPGQITHMWFIAEREGNFEIMCAEYCGLRHSYMEGRVKVVSEGNYNKWLASVKAQSNEKPEGLIIAQNNGCLGCHSLDGSKLVGPSFKGLYESVKTVVANGQEKQVKADTVYIKNSILNPDADVVKGFNKGMMKSYKGIIKDSDIDKIVKYLKTKDDKK
jgi:cytochrome c oxidase subunit 2